MFSSAVSAALSDISAALDVLADVDLAALDAGDLIRLAGRCETLARRQAVLGGDIAVQVGRREIRELGGAPHKVLADWLRITPAAARRRATMAEPLIPRISLAGEPLPPRQPATAAGWRAGELDADHVRVIQRFLAELPCAVTLAGRDWAEGVLAGHARDLRPDQLATLAQKLALILNPDGTFSDADRALRRGLRFERQLPNGMSRVVLWATPALRAELEAWMAKFAAPGMANPADRTPLAEGEPSQAQADADTRTVAQRQHDALSLLLRSQLGNPTLGRHNGLPVTVIVSASIQDLHAKAGLAHTGGTTMLPMSDLIRMAGHAYHYLRIFDEISGRTLWLGRTKRIASADQRIVLHERDRGCTFPGCAVPGYGCQVHHATRDWADGGNTDIDDLVLGCGPHNRLVTKDGWQTRKLPDGTTEWIPPPRLPLVGGVNAYHHPERLLGDR